MSHGRHSSEELLLDVFAGP